VDKVTVRASTPEDAVQVALNIRESDRDEIWASGKKLPIPCLLSAYNRSSMCQSIVVDGDVVCILGVAPVSFLDSVGSPWLIATDNVYKYPVSFLRICQKAVLAMQSSYSTLINYVDDRNKISMTWLSHLGFHVFEDAEPYGPFNMPFHRFELRK